jgi:hypothetical protein
MARLTLPEGDPSMGVSPTMDPLIAQPPRRPRLVVSTPRRRLRAAAPPALLVALLAVALLAAVVATALRAPTARAAVTSSTSAASSASAAPDAVVVAPRAYADADPLIAELARAGARPAIVYLPRAALARVSAAEAARLGALGYAVLRAGAAAPSGVPGAAAGLEALNSLTTAGVAAAGGHAADIPADLPSLAADLKLSPAASTSGQTAPGLVAPAILGRFATVQTATAPMAYAAGTVAVSIIFPQSTATAPKHSENWTKSDPNPVYDQLDPAYPKLTARQGYIVAEVSKALLWWQARAPAAAHLTFVLPALGKLGAPRQITVAREPIAIASTNDQAWRHPIMRQLGHPAVGAADSPPPERAYDNAVRKANGTDWAFTLYVVDSLHDGTAATTPGEFPDGAFAYTYDLFGPYTVTTYDNATYTPGNFDGVLAHEIGHEFGALDEYKAPAGYPSAGTLFSGYLWVKNANAVQGGKTHDVCIMRGGDEGLKAYQGATTYGSDVGDGTGICPSTRGQIGWRVTPPNTLPDVVDTTPTVKLQQPALDGTSATVSGVATEHPWAPGHNAKGRAFAKGISIFVPHALQYSVDGGAWNAAVLSGSGASRTFSFTAALSGPGPDAKAPTRHVVAVQVTTGTTAASSVIAWSAPTPVTLSLSGGASTITLGRKVTFVVHAADAAAPAYVIGFLPGVAVVGHAGATATSMAVAIGAGGAGAVTVAPRFTTTFQVALTPGAQSPFTSTGTPAAVTVAVRALLAAHAGAPSATRVVRVTGSFRPRRGGVPLLLQLRSAGTWRTVAQGRTTAASRFSLAYAARKGTAVLRVRFAGDARNAAATRALPAIVVP